MDDLVSSLPFSVNTLIVMMMAITLILILIVVVLIVKCNKIYKRYDKFMRGRDADTLEGIIYEMSDELKNFANSELSHQNEIRAITKSVKNAFVKYGVVKYDGFKGMGGHASFVLVLLDHDDNGIIINSLHSRDNCYLYLKDIVQGKAEQSLSSEEKECLKKAMGGNRF